MRIALTADPELPVPPTLYGGIERIVDMLARGLVERGHEVMLFAHPDSITAGALTPWKGRGSKSALDTARNAALLASQHLRNPFDIIHSFSRVAYLTPLLPLAVPKIMTYQRAISPRSIRFGHRLSNGTLSFTAVSKWMTQSVDGLGSWSIIPNGVPLDVFELQTEIEPDAPLVFLGRIEEIKGPHLAIEIAKRTGRPLIIAGNIPEDKCEWVEANVLPHVDGNQIRYVGPVDDARKNALLGRAAAFLMPILWDEPFGIVMAEAMACGAPVLALARGSATEIVEDGVTGFVRDDVDGLVAALDQLKTINRRACRDRVVRLYSQDAVVDAYLALYSRRLDRSPPALVAPRQ